MSWLIKCLLHFDNLSNKWYATPIYQEFTSCWQFIKQLVCNRSLSRSYFIQVISHIRNIKFKYKISIEISISLVLKFKERFYELIPRICNFNLHTVNASEISGKQVQQLMFVDESRVGSAGAKESPATMIDTNYLLWIGLDSTCQCLETSTID